MTRFARGKPTHQRVEQDSTPWTQLQNSPTAPSAAGRRPDKGIHRRINKGNSNDNEDSSANFSPIGGEGNSGGGSCTRGSGSTRSVKIFGNFWVGSEDARRLQSVARRLKREGAPRREILLALQSERRRAEKANRRRRDKTCFACRQFGHVLADCPQQGGQSGEEGASTDHCFKCGSTEHLSRHCRKKGEKFGFAKCFICGQSGHIARQCDQNQNGIYPGGGNCDLCGQVTHLKKDCPTLQGPSQQQEEGSVVALRVTNPYEQTEMEEELPMDVTAPTDHQSPEVDRGSGQGKKRRKRKKDTLDSGSNGGEFVYAAEKTNPPTPKKKPRKVKF